MQAFYIIFMSFEDDEEDNPLETPMESLIMMFAMALGEFGDLWETFPSTQHVMLGMNDNWSFIYLLSSAKFIWFMFISLTLILLLNLIIAMMGDTYAQV